MYNDCYECSNTADLNYRSRCWKCQEKFEAAHTKIIVAGGRECTNYPLVRDTLDVLLADAVKRGESLMIISGKARGADACGEQYASEHEYELLPMPAEWDKYGKSAGYRRNDEMAAVADGAVVFWDGVSRGSRHMIDIAKARGIPLRVIKY